MQKFLGIIIIVCLILSLYSLSFSQEQITITTYYPSPYGSYRVLNIQGQVAAGQPVPGIIFSRTDIAPAAQPHWAIQEETNYLVFRDATDTWWGIALDKTNNRVLLNSGVGSSILRIDPNGNIYLNKTEEVTNDPLNGYPWYATDVSPRYSGSCHAPAACP